MAKTNANATAKTVNEVTFKDKLTACTSETEVMTVFYNELANCVESIQVAQGQADKIFATGGWIVFGIALKKAICNADMEQLEKFFAELRKSGLVERLLRYKKAVIALTAKQIEDNCYTGASAIEFGQQGELILHQKRLNRMLCKFVVKRLQKYTLDSIPEKMEQDKKPAPNQAEKDEKEFLKFLFKYGNTLFDATKINSVVSIKEIFLNDLPEHERQAIEKKLTAMEQRAKKK